MKRCTVYMIINYKCVFETNIIVAQLFDFDTEVTPIAEALIADVFRQAMREVLYEDELDARARQQRALYSRCTVEKIEKQRLEHKDERLNKVIVSIECSSILLLLFYRLTITCKIISSRSLSIHSRQIIINKVDI